MIVPRRRCVIKVGGNVIGDGCGADTGSRATKATRTAEAVRALGSPDEGCLPKRYYGPITTTLKPLSANPVRLRTCTCTVAMPVTVSTEAV